MYVLPDVAILGNSVSRMTNEDILQLVTDTLRHSGLLCCTVWYANTMLCSVRTGYVMLRRPICVLSCVVFLCCAILPYDLLSLELWNSYFMLCYVSSDKKLMLCYSAESFIILRYLHLGKSQGFVV